jgi:hypothetical protein
MSDSRLIDMIIDELKTHRKESKQEFENIRSEIRLDKESTDKELKDIKDNIEEINNKMALFKGFRLGIVAVLSGAAGSAATIITKFLGSHP